MSTNVGQKEKKSNYKGSGKSSKIKLEPAGLLSRKQTFHECTSN